jgi:cyclic nucleotide-binding protein
MFLSGIARRVGIEPGEGRLFAWGATTLFLIGWASVSLTNVSETFFLKRIGVQRLPVVFLVNGLLLVGTSYGVSRIAARGFRRLLTGTLAVLGVVVIVLWLLVLAQWPGAFVLLVIAAKQVDAIALMAFWIVLGGLLHGRQAKRLYAPIIAGGTLGRMLGSFASGSVGTAFGIATLLPVSALAIGIAGLLAAKPLPAVPVGMMRRRERQAPARAPLGKFFGLWRDSRLFRLLALGALLGGALAPILYFQFSYIVDIATRGADAEMRLLDLYARLRGIINLAVLAMQIVGTGRVFRRLGVPLASTLSPLVYLVGFCGVSARLDLLWGIGAVSGVNLQDHAIQEPAQRILVTLFPERLRAAAAALIEGPVQRLGGALGNVLVLCALAISTPAWIGVAALPIAATWLAVAIVLWRIYPTLLLELASAGRIHPDVALSLPELMDPGTLRVLRSSLVDPDLRRCRAACELVAQAPRDRAVTALAHAAGQAPAANRPVLVEALHRLLERSLDAQPPLPDAAHHLEPLLNDAGSLPAAARAHLVAAYVSLAPPLGPGARAMRVLTGLLHDPTPAVQLAAAVHLRRAGLLQEESGDLDTVLAEALASGDADVRHTALDALRAALLVPDSADGSARWDARIALVTERLDEPADRARAAEVLADVAAYHGPRSPIAPVRLLAHVHDDDPQVRAAVLRFISQARLEGHVAWAIERLASDDETEAAAAAEALRVPGAAVLPALLDALHHGKRAIREAVLPILHDVHCDAAALRALIDAEIRDVQRLVLQRHGLQAGHVSDLVLQRVDERIGEGLHATLLLLATLMHEDQIGALGHLLARFSDGRRRAALLEALEALLPPAESARLLPLLESSRSPAGVMAAARALGRPLPSFNEALRETIADRDPLTAAFLAPPPEVGPRAHSEATTPRPAPQLLTQGPAGMARDRDLTDHAIRGGGTREDRMLNKVEIILHLRSLDIFERLTTRELSEVANVVHEETYPADATIVREGEFGECMYLIVEGEVRITRDGEFVNRLKPGEFFGEMALFDGETRSATCTASTRLRLLRIEPQDLMQLMDEQPSIAIAMCRTLSGRVRTLIKQLEGRGGNPKTE